MAQLLNVLQKRRIYDDYIQASPGNKGFEGWCYDTAEKYGVKASAVRNTILQYAELEDLTLRQATVSETQKLAALAGATRAEAFKALSRGMHASTKRVITNKDGNIVEVVTQPDYGVQVRAAVEVLKSQGAYEPEKVQIDIAGDPTKLTNDAIVAEIRRLTEQVIGTAEGTEGETGAAGLPVLPDELHTDEGRAGSGEPVQAVPSA